MQRKKYLGVLLVLASDNTKEYKLFKKVYENYMYAVPDDILVLFVYGKCNTLHRNSYNLVYDTIPEGYSPNMLLKTIEAFKEIYASVDFDFLVRTNISTFWNLFRLKDRLLHYRRINLVDTLIGVKGINPPPFVNGTAMVMHKNIVQSVLSNSEDLFMDNYCCIEAEDKVLSRFITEKLNYKLDFDSKQYSMVLRDWNVYNSKDVLERIKHSICYTDSDNYRLRNLGPNRINVDGLISKNLLLNIYGKSI